MAVIELDIPAACFDALTPSQIDQLAEEGRAAFSPATRPPKTAGTYLLLSGTFARYQAGIWYRDAETAEAASSERLRAAFHSPSHRKPGRHAWFGPVAP